MGGFQRRADAAAAAKAEAARVAQLQRAARAAEQRAARAASSSSSSKKVAKVCQNCSFGSKRDQCAVCQKWVGSCREGGRLCNNCKFGSKHLTCCMCESLCVFPLLRYVFSTTLFCIQVEGKALKAVARLQSSAETAPSDRRSQNAHSAGRDGLTNVSSSRNVPLGPFLLG